MSAPEDDPLAGERSGFASPRRAEPEADSRGLGDPLRDQRGSKRTRRSESVPPARGSRSPVAHDMWDRREEPNESRRAGGSGARRPRGATAAGRRQPPQLVDESALHETTEAFEDGSPLNAGRAEAGFASGAEAVAPSRPIRREAVVRSRVGPASLQRGRLEAFNRSPAHSSTQTSAWSGARMRSFVEGGGVAAQFAGSAAGAAVEEPAPGEALEVSDEAVYALLGRNRASLLRVLGLPMQVERQKEWKLRNAQKQQLEAAGKRVPADFCPQVFFFTFQFDRMSMLVSSPIRVRELEQWAWMDGRWVIAEASDMSKSSDFLHILSNADELSARLGTFAEDLRRRPGLPVSQTLRQEVYQLLLRFTTVRARFVADVVEAGLGTPGLRDLHPEFAIIGRIYASNCASLPGFLKSVEDQLATQSVFHTDKSAQEDYCSKAFLCVARAFICGLKGGAAPMGPNPLDEPPTTAAGVGTAVPVPSFAPTQTPQIAPASLQQAVSVSTWSTPSSAYSSAQQPPDTLVLGTCDGQPTFDVMARQTAAGYRVAGPLLGGLAGGGAEGIDLTPSARRVLHAQQMLCGIRAAGALISTPPSGELPPVSSYPPPLVGAPSVTTPYPGMSSSARPPGMSVGLQPPPSYSVGQRSGQRSSTGVGSGSLASLQSAPTGQSDDLYIPYSTGLLGSFSPYRGLAFPSNLTCFECGALQHHYAAECPSRFVRVRGEPPPGWKVDALGAVVKDHAAWNGPDLTDVTRAQYRSFLDKLSLVPHGNFPVSRDEILGPAPVLARRPIPRLPAPQAWFQGGGQRR